MEIRLYNNTSEQNAINKNITNEIILTGSLRNNSNVKTPTIIINSATIITQNYAYIPEFHRYYFINEITSIRSGVLSISLLCDVLMSFKENILACDAVINHTTLTGTNRYLQSDIYKTMVKDFTDIISFPNGLLETGEYILITAGGNS